MKRVECLEASACTQFTDHDVGDVIFMTDQMSHLRAIKIAKIISMRPLRGSRRNIPKNEYSKVCAFGESCLT